jgi:solute carrier family 44 (choline transporter-like protein), member 2/4/5
MQHDIPFVTVISSLKRLLRYSLGSVALGSLVVSVVEWVRFILECLRRKLKLVDSAHESCFGKMTSSSSQCCLGCIDWTLKSVNRNAYIMVYSCQCFHPVTFFHCFAMLNRSQC